MNPGRAINPCRFSRPVLSAAQPSLQLVAYTIDSITDCKVRILIFFFKGLMRLVNPRAVSSFDHIDDQYLVFDLVNNSIITLTYSVGILSCQFNTAFSSGGLSKLINTIQNAFNIIGRNISKIFSNGLLKGDLIICPLFSVQQSKLHS